jgi:hypothetical protein
MLKNLIRRIKKYLMKHSIAFLDRNVKYDINRYLLHSCDKDGATLAEAYYSLTKPDELFTDKDFPTIYYNVITNGELIEGHGNVIAWLIGSTALGLEQEFCSKFKEEIEKTFGDKLKKSKKFLITSTDSLIQVPDPALPLLNFDCKDEIWYQKIISNIDFILEFCYHGLDPGGCECISNYIGVEHDMIKLLDYCYDKNTTKKLKRKEEEIEAECGETFSAHFDGWPQLYFIKMKKSDVYVYYTLYLHLYFTITEPEYDPVTGGSRAYTSTYASYWFLITFDDKYTRKLINASTAAKSFIEKFKSELINYIDTDKYRDSLSCVWDEIHSQP